MEKIDKDGVVKLLWWISTQLGLNQFKEIFILEYKAKYHWKKFTNFERNAIIYWININKEDKDTIFNYYIKQNKINTIPSNIVF